MLATSASSKVARTSSSTAAARSAGGFERLDLGEQGLWHPRWSPGSNLLVAIEQARAARAAPIRRCRAAPERSRGAAANPATHEYAAVAAAGLRSILRRRLSGRARTTTGRTTRGARSPPRKLGLAPRHQCVQADARRTAVGSGRPSTSVILKRKPALDRDPAAAWTMTPHRKPSSAETSSASSVRRSSHRAGAAARRSLRRRARPRRDACRLAPSAAAAPGADRSPQDELRAVERARGGVRPGRTRSPTRRGWSGRDDRRGTRSGSCRRASSRGSCSSARRW